MRLRLGQVLEVMQRNAHCLELGFSSLGAYALERCERSARWVEVACCLAVLAEGQAALLAALPAEAMSLEGLASADEAQRRWREQLASWRQEAEARCEAQIRAAVLEGAGDSTSHRQAAGDIAQQAAQGLESLAGWQSRQLDGEVRRLSAALAGHELKVSQLLWRFHRADGWRRLGYATETQYARERLGLSRSSMMARRSLALRLEGLPQVAQALGRAEIGVAALQLVRIATARTELAWLERARQRTVKHLREEVSAALVAVRLSGDADCPPPRDEELEEFQELERAVLSGRVLGGTANRLQPGCAPEFSEARVSASVCGSSRRPWREMLSSLAAWLEQGALKHVVRMSAPGATGAQSKPGRGAGRVEVRWRVSLGLRTWWHALEARTRRLLPRRMSWVKFLA